MKNSMDNPLFSIIVPVYNVEKYLKKCADSILNQTFKDYEIILVDDGSKDSSSEICDSYESEYQNIKVIHKSNGGSSSARNAGIKEAKGKYVLFLDSDDYWVDRNLLHRLNERIALKSSDVISFNFCKCINDVESEKYFCIGEDMPLDYIEKNDLSFIADNNIWISSACNKAIKNELFQKNDLFFKEKITSEDIDWSCRLALYAESFDYLNIIGFAYVQRESSISHTMTEKKINQLYKNVDLTKELTERADENKKKILYPYLAYQVGVLIFNLAEFENTKAKYDLVVKTKSIVKYLKYSSNKKVKILYFIISVLGLKNTVNLLNLFLKKGDS